MTNKSLGISDVLNDYIQKTAIQETKELIDLRLETMALAESVMQISPEQGQFMSLLVKMLNAKKIIEIGVFTGYSTLCMAKELSDDGLIIACDLSEEWTTIAQSYWRKAGVNDRVDIRIAPALETLSDLLSDGYAESIDLVFIDADKANYLTYYNQAIKLVRKGGLILIDNTLWSGKVADEDDQTEDTVGIRKLNDFIAKDDRVKASLLPVSDGLTLALKL